MIPNGRKWYPAPTGNHHVDEAFRQAFDGIYALREQQSAPQQSSKLIPFNGLLITPQPDGSRIISLSGRGNSSIVQMADSTNLPASGHVAVFDAYGNVKDGGSGPSGGTVTHTGALTAGDVVIGNGSGDLKVLAPPSDATQFLNGAATPAYAQVKDSDLSTSDITTNDVSISKHGFAPKSPNNVSLFLNGTGAYSVPSGTAPANGPYTGNYTPPLVGSYAWVNQGNATAVNTYGPLDLVNLNPSAAWNFNCLVRTIPSAPYRFSALMQAGGGGTGGARLAIILRDSVSGKICAFEIYIKISQIWTLNSDNLNSVTSINTNNFGDFGAIGTAPLWMAIQDDSTTRHFQLGMGDLQKIYWWDIASQSRTNFLTPNQIGYGIQSDGGGTTEPSYLRVLHESTTL